MEVLTATELPRADGLRAVLEPRQLPALPAAVIAHDDEAELGVLPHVTRRAAVSSGVVAHDRHLSK
jgi:hypothetical protein